jgi:enamine deaminase RidA (YjgF/YER057c/UK114 family)
MIAGKDQGARIMALQRINPDTVAAPGGPYTHSIAVPKDAQLIWLAGQTGVAPDGSIPEGIDAQAENAFANLKSVLAAHGCGFEDVVMLRTYLTDRAWREGYNKVRMRYLGDVRPTATFLIVSGLARPELIVEIEAVAAKG